MVEDLGVDLSELTYVFHDTASLPSEPINNLTKPARIVVKESLRINIFCAKHLNFNTSPNGPKDIQRGIGAVLGDGGIVVLRTFLLAHVYIFPEGQKRDSRCMWKR